jgi:two-component system, response regulator PdtaR
VVGRAEISGQSNTCRAEALSRREQRNRWFLLFSASQRLSAIAFFLNRIQVGPLLRAAGPEELIAATSSDSSNGLERYASAPAAAQSCFNSDNSSGGNCWLPENTNNGARFAFAATMAWADSWVTTWDGLQSMPNMDGLEAVKTICKRRPVPVIIGSGTPWSDFLDRAQEVHAYGYLAKPINEADIIPAIELAMGRFEESQALLQERETLRQTLIDRKVVERAKGILMRQTGLDEVTAFRRLQAIARNKRKKLVEIAEMILTAQEAVAS